MKFQWPGACLGTASGEGAHEKRRGIFSQALGVYWRNSLGSHIAVRGKDIDFLSLTLHCPRQCKTLPFTHSLRGPTNESILIRYDTVQISAS